MDILKALFERTDALNGYWNLYIGVSLGLLGLMASAKPFTQRRPIKVLLTLAFLLFAYSNLDAIYHTNGQRRELIRLIEGTYQAVANHAAPPSNPLLIAFHLVLDLLVVLCLWRVRWHQASKAPE